MENKFYTRVSIDKYGCLVIVGDICCNLMSEYAVEKLGLTIVDHPCPYEMWRHGQLISVTKQVLVSFSLGRTYKDSILCDVAHMDDCHLHLGKPWKSYRNVVHDPVTNYYHFVMENKYILVPLSKEQVQQDVDGLKGRVKSWLDEKMKDVDEEVYIDDEPIFDVYPLEEKFVAMDLGEVDLEEKTVFYKIYEQQVENGEVQKKTTYEYLPLEDGIILIPYADFSMQVKEIFNEKPTLAAIDSKFNKYNKAQIGQIWVWWESILLGFIRLVFDSGGLNKNSRANFVHPWENDAVENK